MYQEFYDSYSRMILDDFQKNVDRSKSFEDNIQRIIENLVVEIQNLDETLNADIKPKRNATLKSIEVRDENVKEMVVRIKVLNKLIKKLQTFI